MSTQIRGPLLLLGFSALLTILGAWLKIMSYGGANETLLVGIITFPVAMVWMIYASRQEQEEQQDEPRLSEAQWYLLGLAEQQPEELTLGQIKEMESAHLSSDQLIEAYVLLKNKGLIVGVEEEDTLELMQILQQRG
jgi:hypothetical protein